MSNGKKKWKSAGENDDGTFHISGTEHRNLTLEDFRKLTKLSGDSWLIFSNPRSPHTEPKFPGAKILDFKTAL